MNEPTGYTALDLIGYTDRGDYSAIATYVKNDLTNYGGSKWRCLVDDTTGVTPTEGLNWTVFVQIPADSTKQIIAPVEQATSTHAYTVGKQLIYNDTLYKVKAPIAIGDSLVVDTNIEASDTIVEQIEDAVGDIDDIDDEISAICNVYGSKNFIPYPYYDGTAKTDNGVTFAVDSDGIITANRATASSSVSTFIVQNRSSSQFYLPAGTYKFTACSTGGSLSSYYAVIGRANNGAWELIGADTGDGVLFTVSDAQASMPMHVTVEIAGGYDAQNVVFSPMIKDARIKDNTRVPYTKTNRELTEDTLYSEPTVSGLTKTKITKVGKTITMTFNSENPATLKGVTIPAELRPPYDIHGTVIYRDTATHTIYYAGLLDITSAGAVYMYYTPTYGSARTEITTNTTGIELIGTITYLTK